MLNPDYELRLLHCFICRRNLQDHPLYWKSGAKICPNHGDYFVRPSRSFTPDIVFRPFNGPDIELTPLRRFTTNGGTKPTAEYKRIREGRPRTFLECEQTGVIYLGLDAAAYGIGSHPHEISKHLRGIRTHIRGYTFKRLDQYGDPLYR